MAAQRERTRSFVVGEYVSLHIKRALSSNLLKSAACIESSSVVDFSGIEEMLVGEAQRNCVGNKRR